MRDSATFTEGTELAEISGIALMALSRIRGEVKNILERLPNASEILLTHAEIVFYDQYIVRRWMEEIGQYINPKFTEKNQREREMDVRGAIIVDRYRALLYQQLGDQADKTGALGVLGTSLGIAYDGRMWEVFNTDSELFEAFLDYGSKYYQSFLQGVDRLPLPQKPFLYGDPRFPVYPPRVYS